MMSSKIASCDRSAGPTSESVELSRCYPAPEMVQLPVDSASPSTTAGTLPPPLPSPSSSDQAGATLTLPECSTNLSVRLRWGVQATELRRIHKIHEDVYPILFNASFYKSLLDHDTSMCLMALVTEETYRECLERRRVAKDAVLETAPAPSESASSSWWPSLNSTDLTHPPPVSQCSVTAEIMEERALIECAIAEQESLAARKKADAGPAATKGVSQEEEGDAATHTVVIGLVIGQNVYARHDKGHLFANPTSYINSFAVDPLFQRCGVGRTLIHRFITYVTQRRPLYAQDYLHYDQRKLIALLADAKIKKRKAVMDTRPDSTVSSTAVCPSKIGGDGNRHEKDDCTSAPPQLSSPASARPSFLQNLVSMFLPELQSWMEDRQARHRLRSRGLTEDEIDAQRYRECLAPSLLTDEEADEVRREARTFVVQVGVADVWLHCLRTNTKAITFYAHHGFNLHRVIDAFYTINGTAYDGHLLHYVDGSAGLASFSSTSAESSSAVTADTLEKTGGLEEQEMRCAALNKDEGTGPDGAAPLTAAAPESSLSPPLLSSTGLRRRRGTSTAGKDSGLAAAHSASTSGASRTAIPVAAAAAAAATTTTTPAVSADTPATNASPSKRGSQLDTLWLSPSTYPFVADIIFCTPESGQEEWRRRKNPKNTGEATGSRLGPWEVARETMFVVNAVLLLCAVLWLAYNVVLTGKVE
ncbi:hypothetical protein JKF63_06611 [Porcisia hertigi]|uniref:N-alpha-acetyltransferase 60 n=1 Tax=Porcisia hertigi TaxID=2761500 RepID=A0A836IKM1_9TRYP|nr:hypothetical protein JKF63_06611 [Porcisia hertigi]